MRPMTVEGRLTGREVSNFARAALMYLLGTLVNIEPSQLSKSQKPDHDRIKPSQKDRTAIVIKWLT